MYHLVFKGNTLPNTDLPSLKNKAKNLFKLTDDQVDVFFSGKKIYLKKGISLEQGEALKEKLLKVGLITYLESSQSDQEQSSDIQSTPIKAPNNISSHKHDESDEKVVAAPKYFSFRNEGNCRVDRTRYIRGLWQGMIVGALPILTFINFIWLIRYSTFRARDIGMGGQKTKIFYSIVFLLLLISIFFVIKTGNMMLGYMWYALLLLHIPFFMIMPGAKGKNEFGYKTESGKRIDIALFFIVNIALTVAFFFLGSFIARVLIALGCLGWFVHSKTKKKSQIQ